jgi:RNA polymerase subunit RPABC4/transcription elongation factor Spt4
MRNAIRKESILCSVCGALVPHGETSCPVCRSRLLKTCSSCSLLSAVNVKNCPRCGNQL